MSLGEELRSVLGNRAESGEPPLPDIDALKSRGLVRRRRHRLLVAVPALAVLAILAAGLAWGQTRLHADGGSRGPIEQPVSSLAGRWMSTDGDGSSQTMTIRPRSDGEYEMVLRDDLTGQCSGPSTDTGAGRVAGERLIVTDITTDCRDGQDFTGGGALTFVHHPATDTLTDSAGVTWSREGAASDPPDEAEATTDAFLGHWTSVDGDRSHQTMTIRPRSDGEYEMVLRDDFTGPCSGPSTDSGTGGLIAGELMITGIVTVCQDGGLPAGAGHALTFVHHAGSDTLRDDYGVVWSRE
jgi:hypothetical protein